MGVAAALLWSFFPLFGENPADTLVDSDLSHVVETTYLMVASQDALLRQVVEHNLSVARHILNGAGGASLAPETVTWNAVNQFTKQAQTVSLPKMLVGGTWLGQQTNAGAMVPVVDKVKSLVGGTCTIFQRMKHRVTCCESPPTSSTRMERGQ